MFVQACVSQFSNSVQAVSYLDYTFLKYGLGEVTSKLTVLIVFLVGGFFSCVTS